MASYERPISVTPIAPSGVRHAQGWYHGHDRTCDRAVPVCLPLPLDFFKELFEGRCLAEAFYRTNPFNSWQLVLIGDPLYTPFRKR